MVTTERHHNLAAVDRNDSPAVAHIGRVAHVANNKDHYCTRAGSINHYDLTIIIARLTLLQKGFLSLLKAANDGFFGILRETVLLDDKMVQLVAQELSARMPSVAIVDAKKAALRPLLVFPMTRLCDV